MCDYSKHADVRSLCTRRAKVGDELYLANLAPGVLGFLKWRKGEGYRPGVAWRGRASVTCIRPGTEIELERRFTIPTSRSNIEVNGEVFNVEDIAPSRLATFARLPGGLLCDGPGRSVDGIEWPNGLRLGLAGLPVGIGIRVVQLPVVKRRKRAKAGKTLAEAVADMDALLQRSFGHRR